MSYFMCQLNAVSVFLNLKYLKYLWSNYTGNCQCGNNYYEEDEHNKRKK